MRYFTLTLVTLLSIANICHAEPAKYEPERGLYLGVTLDWQDLSTKGKGKHVVDKYANGIKDFNSRAQKKHALVQLFVYFPHGAPDENPSLKGRFPSWDYDPAGLPTIKEFCEAASKAGAAPLLSLEPWVFLDFYTNWGENNPAFKATKELALACANFKKPLFIRFAHEMNGSWYPWCTWLDKNKNLKKDKGEESGVTARNYVTAFRNVATIFKRYAPNVAIIWSPQQGWLGREIADNYTKFYPGDEYVDWVGLDFYERGWDQPNLTHRLWGGLFGYGLTHDSLDDPNTKKDESVNFYETFCVKKNKPLMICETGAMLTYRNDLPKIERRKLSRNWKGAWWSPGEYGWIMGLYATSYFDKLEHDYSTDLEFPKLKGIVWFNLAKAEDVATVKKKDGKEEVEWFANGFCDYRIGYDAMSEDDKYAYESKSRKELELYRGLIKNPYFLSEVKY